MGDDPFRLPRHRLAVGIFSGVACDQAKTHQTDFRGNTDYADIVKAHCSGQTSATGAVVIANFVWRGVFGGPAVKVCVQTLTQAQVVSLLLTAAP